MKRLAVALDTPGLFWSAAEDGLVMQWDSRQVTNCHITPPNCGVLLPPYLVGFVKREVAA